MLLLMMMIMMLLAAAVAAAADDDDDDDDDDDVKNTSFENVPNRKSVQICKDFVICTFHAIVTALSIYCPASQE